MTVEQLALIAVAPTALPQQQQAVYDALTQAGHDGLESSEAGAIAHAMKDSRWGHPADERCQFCGSAGRDILRALEAKGLARYRRKKRNVPGAWITATADSTPALAPSGMLRDDQPLPY